MASSTAISRTPTTLDQLSVGDIIVAYDDDAALDINEPMLGGAIELVHMGDIGVWDVKYRDGKRVADGLVNLSDAEHIFYVSAGHRAIGHNGPWQR